MTQQFLDYLSDYDFSSGEVAALDRLVRDIHGETNVSYATLNIVGKFSTIYPLVGASALPHAANLIDPTAHNITWVGSPTHSANGVSFNGVNQYGNTNLRTETEYADGNKSFHCYATNHGGGFLYGQWNAGSGYVGIRMAPVSDIVGAGLNAWTGSLFITANKMTSINMNGPQGKIYADGASVYTGSASSETPPIGNVYLGGLNYFNGYDMIYPAQFQCRFFAIASSMTSAEHLALSNAVIAYQTALSRL